MYSSLHRNGEHIGVFPISNWTEMDVRHYTASEGLSMPSVYIASDRSLVDLRDVA
ncbi:MAG: phosphoadenosine phosphosulfate reductase family protein [bacterium]|nr:phosphoadenosine phosphosulfate reductase family protein [bacterium]MCP4968124.1 phosphoadenosine phosphosulfate reductase family protein [bacterium]